MGSRNTDGGIRGFLVHDRRISMDTLDAADSSYTEASPRPASIVAADTRSLALPAISGGQTNDLDLVTLRGGNPVPTVGAGLGYRVDGEGGAAVRSWNVPNLLQHHVGLIFATGSTLTYEWGAVAVHPDTQVVVVVTADTPATAPSVLATLLLDPETRVWSAGANVLSDISGLAASKFSPVCAMCWYPPLRRFIVFAFVIQESFYSDDTGASWLSNGPTRYDNITNSFGANTIAQPDQFGNILLCGSAGGFLMQYASNDAGASFTEIGTTATWADDLDVAQLANGSLIVAYIDNTTKDLEVRILGSAYDDITSATAISLDTSAFDEVLVVVDADGVAYVQALATTSHIWATLYSLDNGQTWTTAEATYVPEVATSYASNVRSVAVAGEILWVHNSTVPTSTTNDGSLWATTFGGWSNLEVGVLDPLDALFENRASFAHSDGMDGRWWVPIELPANMGWTETTTGAGAVTLGLQGWGLATTAPDTVYEEITRTYDQPELVVVVEMRVNGGGSLATQAISFDARRQDGTNEYYAKVQITSTGFRLYDLHGAATLGTDAVVTLTSSTQIMLVFRNSTPGDPTTTPDLVSTFYRSPGSATWTAGPAGTLTGNANVGTTDRLRWGHILGSTADTDWKLVAFSGRMLVRNGLATAAGFERCRWGKQVAGSALPYPIRDQGDATHRSFLSLRGARARYGETFAADANHDYALANLFHPSPARGWRSTQSATAEEFAFELGGYDTRLAHGWVWALCVVGKNCPQLITLQEKSSGGAYATIGIMNLAADFSSLTYSLTGDTLRAGAGTTAGARMVWESEFVGGYVIIDPSGTPKSRPIVGNSAGVWSDDATTVQCSLQLGGIDGTEPATGTVHIVSPGGVLIIPQTAAAGNHTRHLKVIIGSGGAGHHPDGRFEFGSLILGSVLIPGRQNSDGWSWRNTPNVVASEDEYGTLHTRKVGPTVRELTVSWQDPQDWLSMRSDASPDYLAAGSSRAPEAVRNDVMQRLAGMLYESRGGEQAIVALADIPNGNSFVTITDPTLWLAGTLTGAVVQGNQVVGDEGAGEVYRVESLTIREQPWDVD